MNCGHYIHMHCLMCVCNVLTNYYFVCVCVFVMLRVESV